MAKSSGKGEPISPLHAALLRRLRRIFEAKALAQGRETMPISEGMKLAGASEQLYQQWKNGASPKLVTLETMAAKLGISLQELLGLRTPAADAGLKPEAAEVAE